MDLRCVLRLLARLELAGVGNSEAAIFGGSRHRLVESAHLLIIDTRQVCDALEHGVHVDRAWPAYQILIFLRRQQLLLLKVLEQLLVYLLHLHVFLLCFTQLLSQIC